jgi:DNA-binding beta-propeller fold protein YncE
MLVLLPALAQPIATGPELPHRVVKDWAKLPDGWNLGETSGVSTDKDDNVWVFNRGPHPILQFDKSGRMLKAWTEVPVTSAHGIKVDPSGNVWAIDVKGHMIFQFSPSGKIQMALGNAGKQPGNNDSTHAFNEPTAISFLPDGGFYVSDGYKNSRVLKYNKDGIFQLKWGSKGTGDGQFDLVHDVVPDNKGRVFVADRLNERIQVFDQNGKFLTKWTGLGSPWGLAFAAKEDALYMCDGKNNRIVKLNLDGQLLGVLSGFGKVQGRLDFPHHIAIDSEGSIYVAEIQNWRVQKFAIPK